MGSIARSSKHGLKIDFNKSHDCYIYDKLTNRKYLDFFGMYASLPLGYNNYIFKSKEFKDEVAKASAVKLTNCEMLSDEAIEFDKTFQLFCSRGDTFKFFHYCCTGALALEAAIKCAIRYKQHQKKVKVLSFEGCFHGINSWGCFVTSRQGAAASRLGGYPEPFSIKMISPETLDEIEKIVANIRLVANDLTAIVVEPIRCTAGDRYYKNEFFVSLRELCDQYDIPLIFDEVQIGFGSTGKVWYHEHIGVTPDIVMFGKKTQLSGIMVSDKVSKIFDNSIELEVTWDATLIDMIRCRYIIQAYKQQNILLNVVDREKQLVSGLKQLSGITNIRSSGLVMAFDLPSEVKFNKFIKKTKKYGIIFNTSGKETIRLRPSLSLNLRETEEALNIIETSLR